MGMFVVIGNHYGRHEEKEKLRAVVNEAFKELLNTVVLDVNENCNYKAD